jgi:hypothetical protein
MKHNNALAPEYLNRASSPNWVIGGSCISFHRMKAIMPMRERKMTVCPRLYNPSMSTELNIDFIAGFGAGQENLLSLEIGSVGFLSLITA